MSAEQTRDIGEMALVDAALERLRDGSFGICVGCHRRIPLRRLKAQPSAAKQVVGGDLTEPAPAAAEPAVASPTLRNAAP